MFMPLLLLQILNLFWYYLIWRVAIRHVSPHLFSVRLITISPRSLTNTLTDVRSDDEDDGDDDANANKDE